MPCDVFCIYGASWPCMIKKTTWSNGWRRVSSIRLIVPDKEENNENVPNKTVSLSLWGPIFTFRLKIPFIWDYQAVPKLRKWRNCAVFRGILIIFSTQSWTIINMVADCALSRSNYIWWCPEDKALDLSRVSIIVVSVRASWLMD